MAREGAAPTGGLAVGRRGGDELPLLAAASLLAAALALLEAPLPARLPLGLLAVLILPGYSLAALLFPRADDLETVERLGLSFAASLAVAIVLALALNYSPWGLRPAAVVLALTAWTVLATGAAWWRRRRLPPRERWSVDLGRLRWGALDRGARLGVAVLAGALLLAGVAIAATVTAPPPPMTEFYILGPEGLAEGYPRQVRAGELVSLTVGIANREGRAARYRVRVEAEGQSLATLGPLDLAGGEAWEGQVVFALPRPAKNQEVRLVLSRDDAPEPYRWLRLWLEVADSRGRS